MDELAVYQRTVELAPLEDVAKFMLIAPEKAKAQAAEIRAMRNLGVAQEVLAQKEEEQRMLNELILDAGARIGELTREIPKASGGDRRSESFKSDSGATFEKAKTKEQIGMELGFTRSDMSRFEKLAENRDLIEEEKAHAREENRQPTRTNVLEAIQVRAENKVLEYADEHPDKSYREIAKSTGTNHQFVSRTIEKNRQKPRGYTSEDRENRAQTVAIVAEMFDVSTIGEMTIERLVDDIVLNATEYISILRNTLTDHSTLLTKENKPIIASAIQTHIIDKIIELKGVVEK